MTEEKEEDNSKVVNLFGKKIDVEQKAYKNLMVEEAKEKLAIAKSKNPLTILVIGQNIDGKPIFETNLREIPNIIYYLEKLKKDLLN